MLNPEFILCFTSDSYWVVDMIEVFLYNQLGYCCCMGVPQVRVVSPSVHDRTNRLQIQGFYIRDSCSPWGFKGNPLNLDRRHSEADCKKPMDLEWYRGHCGDTLGHIPLALIWHRDCIFRS